MDTLIGLVPGYLYDLVLVPLLKIIIIVLGLTVILLAMNWIERKILAHIQSRLGPMRVGPHGILQPIADALKFLLKEDIIPARADKLVFILAPAIAVVPAFVVFSVIPFGPAPKYVVADVNIGILFILGVSSVTVLGIILGGWASNSKYPLLGGLRSSAQMVSYEVGMGFAIISVLLIAQSLSLVEIVEAQRRMGLWFFFVQPVAFVVYFICASAEVARLPFDLPEAESELVAGYHTEYSGFRFIIYVLAEYTAMIAVSSVAITLFWGGWLRPFPNVAWLGFLDIIPPVGWFMLKLAVFLYLYIWMRGTFPRFRFDQLMQVGWKILLPIGIANVIATGAIMLVLD